MPAVDIHSPAIDHQALADHLRAAGRLLASLVETPSASELQAFEGALGRGAILQVVTTITPLAAVSVRIADGSGTTIELGKPR